MCVCVCKNKQHRIVTLNVGRIVKVADKQVAFHKVANRLRHDEDTVWVDVAVRGHGGGDQVDRSE